jgi:hypothetical protein
MKVGKDLKLHNYHLIEELIMLTRDQRDLQSIEASIQCQIMKKKFIEKLKKIINTKKKLHLNIMNNKITRNLEKKKNNSKIVNIVIIITHSIKMKNKMKTYESVLGQSISKNNLYKRNN